MATKQIVVLGGGTAGTMMANKLVRAQAERDYRVTVVDQDDAHVYQSGLLFVPFQEDRGEEIQRSRRRFLDPRARVLLEGVDRVAPEEKKVFLRGGEVLEYDVLIVATGCRIVPEAVPGLTGTGWRESAFDFYTPEGASALRAALHEFKGGQLVVHVAESPIKCPVAPLEFLLLAEAFFSRRGMRDKVKITYVTPLDGAFTRPRASELLGELLARRGIDVVPDFNVAQVDGQRRMIRGYDGREVAYDLLVTVPPNSGAEVIARSGMADETGFFPTDKHTLRSTRWDSVFAIGDATNLPVSKAGSAAHFQSDVLLDNVLRHLDGRELCPAYDGHVSCFIETGYGKAMMIDFNYATEPLPGRYPLPGVGPFTLLEESPANHWGKLAFRWLYWNVLLEGKELPVDPRMTMAGKWS